MDRSGGKRMKEKERGRRCERGDAVGHGMNNSPPRSLSIIITAMKKDTAWIIGEIRFASRTALNVRFVSVSKLKPPYN